MGPHFSWEINLGNLITGIPLLLIMIRMYGDWRVMRERINILWITYCQEHKIVTIDTLAK
jgi:hypothetical protein